MIEYLATLSYSEYLMLKAAVLVPVALGVLAYMAYQERRGKPF